MLNELEEQFSNFQGAQQKGNGSGGDEPEDQNGNWKQTIEDDSRSKLKKNKAKSKKNDIGQ